MSRHASLRWIATSLIASLLLVAAIGTSSASCLEVRGDINADNVTTVVDVQCAVLLTLWEVSGQVGPQPGCVGVSLLQADMTCDGSLNISDVLIVVNHALGIPLSPAIDSDQNGCVDFCELDSDGDGDGDFLDCAPYDAAIGIGGTEICNGIDDDCDGIVDNGSAGSVIASCQNGDVCDGEEICAGQPAGLGIMIHEIMVNPAAVADADGEWVELYNPTSELIDINGWSIADNLSSHKINNGGPLRIAAGGYIVLGLNADPAQNGGFNIQYVYSGLALSNTADIVQLVNPDGDTVDSVGYGAGWPITSGASLALTDPAADNSLAASWAASTSSFVGSTGDLASPKAANADVIDVATCGDGPDLVCDDSVDCTTDACDPATGCSATADDSLCDDGVDCTTDSCDATADCQFVADDSACDDGVDCTIDACDATNDCQFTPDDSTCDDGVLCTADICDATNDCQSIPTDIICDDGVDCTIDSCDATADCQNTTNDAACDDGVDCTVDVCDATAGCGSTADDSLCDDGVDCTTDSCNASEGCEFAADDASCDDGVDCTDDACDATNDCQNVPNDASCDDGVDCTDDACDATNDCQSTPNDGSCDDGIDCTVDACDSAAGCGNTSSDELCDDGDVCTFDTCTPTGCSYAANPAPECTAEFEGDTFCAVAGPAGTTATCQLRMSRFNELTPAATAANFQILFDPALIQVTGMSSSSGAIPPNPLPTGHTVLPIPADFTSWPGLGDVFVLHLSDPTVNITDAFQQGGTPVGNTLFAEVEVELLQEVDLENAATLDYANIAGSTAAITGMVGTVQNGVMVMNIADCNDSPSACDDGDACTTDTCDASGACTNEPTVCDDGDACNGLETCQSGTGCVSGAAPSCDDGIDCTADSCDPASGCVNAGDDSLCDDGVACTDNACAAGTGCEYTANDGNCDDGISCTIDLCDETGGCSNTPSDAACDDGFDCTTEVCDALLDCEYTTDDSSCPDDGNPCTDDICVVGAGCAAQVSTEIECLPEGVLCAVSGTSGDTVICPVKVARATVGTPAPAGLQYALSYDDATMTLTGYTDAGGDAVPPTPLATGHSLFNSPPVLPAWSGTGTTFALNLDDPAATLTDSYLANGAFVGDSLIMNLNVQLDADIDAATPAYIMAEDITGSTADVAGMVGTVEAGVIVLAAADCTNVASACDDGDPCTIDGCDAGSGACTYTTVGCDDGDACNGTETCLALVGCQPGPAPVCDDGEACTTEVCDPIDGCVYTTDDSECDDSVECTIDVCEVGSGCLNTPNPIACNDGVSCTDDVCDATTGCSNTANDTACDDGAACTSATCDATLGCQFTADDSGCADDGNPCTADICVVGVGCSHEPLNSPECLIPDALCAISGTAGDSVTCTVNLARATQATPMPATLEISIDYNDAALTPAGFSDGGTPVPPATLAPSGHGVFMAPPMPAWGGSGTAFFLNFSDPAAPLSMAYWSVSSYVGDTQVVDLTFDLATDIDPATPEYVTLSGITASTANVEAMSAELNNGIIRVGLATCTDAACDDGNPCTDDSCNAATGACEYATTDCADGDACTGTEICLEWLGCTFGPPLDCDDGADCSTDSCDPAAGCLYVTDDAQCSDGEDCTDDSCQVGGCLFDPVDSACDDGVSCTLDVCDPASGCVNTATDSLCDDGFPCTTETCDAVNDCEYSTNDVVCDDGDSCTIDTCEVGVGCAFAVSTDPTCLPDGAICAVSGSAGDQYECDLQVAASTATMPDATALDFAFSYDPTQIRIAAIEDTQCIGPGFTEPCFTVEVPPGSLAPSNHQVAINPATIDAWNGAGSMIIFNAADPTAAVSGAYRDGGAIVGDAAIATFILELVSDVSASAPATLSPTNLEGGTATVTLLLGEVEDGVILMSTDDCTGNEAICDDGNLCTDDACVDGACVYTPTTTCDDGDACNGAETCNAATGGCDAGTPLECDDNIDCTVDACDATIGCFYTPDDSACPDTGDACTVGVCSDSMGCVEATAQTGECLPDGALCAVWGALGETKSCTIDLARSTAGGAAPTSIQFTVSYDDSQVTLADFTDEFCFGPGGAPPCIPQSVPPGVLIPSGHSVIIAPASLGDWNGSGTVFVLHASAPTTPVTDAVYEGGSLSGGSPAVMDAQFQLDTAVSPLSPVYLWLDDAIGTSTGLDSLIGTAVDGLIVVAP